MAIRKVAVMGHPVLRQVSETVAPGEVGTQRIQRLIDDLIETAHEYDGAGIASPQIYEPVRICLIEIRDNPRYPHFPNVPLTILINPKITVLNDDKLPKYEGCLSVPGIRGLVHRSRGIRVDALDRHGEPLSFQARDLFAATVQHELDHLDGKLFVDNVTDTRTLTFIPEYDRYWHKKGIEMLEAAGAELRRKS